MAKLDWLVVRDLVDIESSSFWLDGPEIETGELKHRGDRDGGVLPARRLPRREGRLLHEHPAAAPVAPQSRRTERRLPLGALVLLPPRPCDQADGSQDSNEERDQPCSSSPGTTRSRATQQEPSAEAVLAEINGWNSEGKALSGYQRAKGRRLDELRLLDLLRRPRRRGQPGGPQEAALGAGDYTALEWAWAWPANRRHPLQPRLGRSRGQAVVGAEALRLVGRSRRKVDGPRRARLRARTSALTTNRRTTPKARTAIAGDHPFIMQADGRGWLYVPQGLVDGPLPAHYEPHESPFANPLYRSGSNPARQNGSTGPRTRTTRRTSPDGGRLPVRRHDLPADRAPHRRRDEPHRPLPGRAAARDVLSRCIPSSPKLRGSSTAAGRRSSPPRSAIEARVLVTERMKPLAASTAAASIRSACPTTGARKGLVTRRRRERPQRPIRSTRTSTSRRSRRSPATSGRATAPRRRASAFVTGPLR